MLYALILVIDGMHEPMYCDESSFLKNVCGFIVNRSPEPVFVNYPTFFSYLLAAPIYAAFLIYYIFIRHFPWEGLGDIGLFALVFQGELDIWLWVGRSISILFAVGILALVYQYCFSRLSRPAAVLAVVLLISSPYSFYMHHAHYALPDIFVAFLVTCVLFIASRHVEYPRDRGLNFAGFLAGLAASAKLNGLLALAPLFVLPWIASAGMPRKWRSIFFTAGWALVGFTIGSPFIIVKPQAFVPGYNLESNILYAGNSGLEWLIPALWREDPVMTVLTVAAIIFSFFRRSKKDMVFHAILIPSVIFLGSLSKQSPHYLLFLLPWICVMIGEFFQEILKRERPVFIRWLVIAGLVGIVVYAGHRLVDRVIKDCRPDNRTIAREWIRINIPAEAPILLDQGDLPRMGFIDLGVMPSDQYIFRSNYPDIVREYSRREYRCNFAYLSTYGVSTEDLRVRGWKYFVTSDNNFKHYLESPAKVDEVQNGPNGSFLEFLTRRKFYLQLFQESDGLRVFKEGSGPQIYIFKIL